MLPQSLAGTVGGKSLTSSTLDSRSAVQMHALEKQNRTTETGSAVGAGLLLSEDSCGTAATKAPYLAAHSHQIRECLYPRTAVPGHSQCPSTRIFPVPSC